MNDRFLSVRLGPFHADYAKREGLPDALVLELDDGQWALYCLDNTETIDFAVLVASLDAGIAYAATKFGVRADEWVEEFTN